MGTGKTKSLIRYIQDHFGSGNLLTVPRILVVSFRQTFTQEILCKLNRELVESGISFLSYKDITGTIVED
jgi:hypothetical protein